MYIREHPKMEKYIKSFPNHSSVMLDKLLPDLREEDVRKIMETYWGLKKRYTELLVDSIVHPEKPEYAKGEEARPLLTYLKAEIKRRQQKTQ